jgi:sulfatase modifying factor 1
MKKNIAAAVLMLLSVLATTQQKPVITVLDFKTSGVSEQEMKAIISLISNTLFKTGKFTVIDVTQRELLLKEIEFSLSGCVEEFCQIEIGKQLSAEMIVVGRIDKVGNNLILTSKVLETQTAKTVRVADGVYRDLDELVRNIGIFCVELAGLPPPADAPKKESPSTTSSTEIKRQPAPPGFVLVEAGSFRMGSNDGDKERPVHSVTISRSLFISQYEATQKQWREVMGKNPSSFTGDNLPVQNINWYEVVEYCNRLSRNEGLTPCYSGSGDNIECDFLANGYRLPTEAEWEYAARGGKKSRGYIYAGSNSAKQVSWYNDNSKNQIQPVGQKLPNELGLYDMSGNVSEWCWDWYGNYSPSAQTDPCGPLGGSNRVNRGGAWYRSALTLRSASRDEWPMALGTGYLGFRPVRKAE